MGVSVEMCMNFEQITVNMASDESHCGCHLVFRQFCSSILHFKLLQIIQTRKKYIFTILFFLLDTSHIVVLALCFMIRDEAVQQSVNIAFVQVFIPCLNIFCIVKI